MYSLTTKLTFGQFKGMTIQEVIDHVFKVHKHQNYLYWCILNVEWFELDEKALNTYRTIKEQYDADTRVNMNYYHIGDEGTFTCPGSDIGMSPEDHGISMWGH